MRGGLLNNPSNVTVTEWFDAAMLEIDTPWALGKLMNPAKWQDHAVAFLRASPYNQRTLPDPYQFKDWREWATRAYPMMEAR